MLHSDAAPWAAQLNSVSLGRQPTVVMTRRTNTLPPVSLGGVVEERALQYAWVEYPEHYGSIFRFSCTPSGPFRFCACSKRAIANIARLNAAFPRRNNADPRRMAIVDSLLVPKAAAAETVGWAAQDVDRLDYYETACHRCNRIPPTRRWCHEMYGDPWKQAYGWFPYLAALEGGVDPWDLSRHLVDQIPHDVAADIADFLPLHDREQHLLFAEPDRWRSPELKPLRKSMQSVKSRVMRFFTSEARVAFGFERVGEGWVSETMLFRTVQSLLPAARLIRHFRPPWLEGLELDIYLPEVNVGIEYQGAQHASPVEHWGGADALARQKQRDARKRELCNVVHCRLIEVWSGTELNEATIGRILSDAGLKIDLYAS